MVKLTICTDPEYIGEFAELFNYDQFEMELHNAIRYEWGTMLPIVWERVETGEQLLTIEVASEELTQWIEDALETIDITDNRYYLLEQEELF